MEKLSIEEKAKRYDEDLELDEIISLNEKLRMENKRLRREFKYKKELYEHLTKNTRNPINL